MLPDGPIAVSRPGIGERLAVVAFLFVMGFGLPDMWTATRVTDERSAVLVARESGGDLLITVVLLGFFAYFLTRLVGNFRFVRMLVERELLLPLFIAWMVSSTLWSDDPWLSFRRSMAIALVLVVGYYLVVRFDLAEIIRLAAIAYVPGTLVCYAFVLGSADYGKGGPGADWYGIFDGRNSLGRSAVLGCLLYALAARTDRRHRTFWYPMLAASAVLVLGSHSKTSLGSMLMLAVMLIVFTAFRARKTLYGAVTVTMITAVVAAILWATANVALIADWLDKDPTLSGRLPLWEEVVEEIGRRPVFGHGFEAFWGGYFSPAHHILMQSTWTPPHAHNAVLDDALEMGLVGAGLFIALFIRTVIRSARYVRYRPTAVGLFPLAFCSFTLLFSITESGVVGRNIFFVLLVVTVGTVTATRRPRGPEEAIAQDLSRHLVSTG